MSDTETQQDYKSLKKLASDLVSLANPTCTLCPLHTETSRVCIPVNPPRRGLKVDGQQIRLIVVGEAPGGSEEETGVLFSGNAGRLLDELLLDVGLKREWFFVTNAVKCRPEANRTPTAREIRACGDSFLRSELDLIQPHYGLALGNAGLQATFGKKGITKMNGTTYEAHGVTWVAGFHPAAVLRNPRYRQPLRQALLVLSRLVKNEEGAPVTNAILVNDKESLKALLAEMESHDYGAIDTETWSSHPGHNRFKGGGLAYWHDDWTVATVQFSFTPGRGYTLPLWHKDARWKDPQKVVDLIKPHVERIKWVMQNGKYDMKVLHKIGIDVEYDFDTMGAAYALDENNIKDLGFLSQVYLAAPEYKEMVDKSNMIAEPLDLVNEYGARDTDYTLRLKGVMTNRLKSEGLSDRLFRKLLMPADRVLASVELTGMPLNRAKFVGREIETLEQVEASIERIQEVAGRAVNPRSPKQLGEVLYGDLGLPVIKTTKTGNPSTDEATLIRLDSLDDSGVLKEILNFRHWDGYRSRYFKAWGALMDKNGRLHPHFKPFHTVTGRLSCEHPNVQQIPRDTFIRGIVGGRKGWQIVEVDYSQVELRIVAHYSQDKAMLRAFNTGRDIHLETAMAVTGLSEEEITSEIRKKAKAVNFGFVYGMGWRKFKEYAKTNYGIDVTDAEAQEARKAFFDLFRGLPEWHRRQRSAAVRRGWVVSAIGRKRRLHDIESTNKEIRAEAERQAINSPVQSLASDMMLMAMVILHERLDPSVARIISTVHDAILFQIRDEALDDLLPMIVETMENLPLEEWFESRLTVPIEVESKVGRYWSEGSRVIESGSLVY